MGQITFVACMLQSKVRVKKQFLALTFYRSKLQSPVLNSALNFGFFYAHIDLFEKN
jgi:hypothetical protein